MPTIVQGHNSVPVKDFKDVDYKYDYKDGLNLKPGSKKHDDLVKLVLDRARASACVMAKRHSSWREIDHVLTGYVMLSDKEREIKRSDKRKPVSIVFPYSYAILETLLSYLCAAFFQDPIFRYEGTGPEDVVGATLLQNVIQLHCEKTKVPLNLHTFFRDNLAYGVGAVAPVWIKRYSKKPSKSLIETLPTNNLAFEGNGLINIDPYSLLLDPSVPVQRVQDGEFVGWVEHTNIMNLLSEEQNSEGTMFNSKYIKHVGQKQTTIMSADPSGRNTKNPIGTLENDNITNPVDVITLYVKIIPKDHELGSGEYPEKWVFKLAADCVLIEAHSLGLWHDDFPIALGAPEFDGYSTCPISRLETLFGLQGTLDWLFNAHVTNVRKAINDVLIYDPFLINGEDLKKPEEGKLIRTRRPAWGKGVKDSIMQLPVSDVTRGHIADSAFIVQWMQRIGISDDSTMGGLRQGGPERLTEGEFQGTKQGTFSRMNRIVQILSYQGLNDIGNFFAAHTQQFLTQDVFVKVTGDWQRKLQEEYGADAPNRFAVSPQDLDVNYDVSVREGVIPGSNYSQVFERMFDQISNNPELAQRFDLTKIFLHIARNNGAKNADEFIRNTQVSTQPNAEVLAQAQAGNAIPVAQAQEEGIL